MVKTEIEEIEKNGAYIVGENGSTIAEDIEIKELCSLAKDGLKWKEARACPELRLYLEDFDEPK